MKSAPQTQLMHMPLSKACLVPHTYIYGSENPLISYWSGQSEVASGIQHIYMCRSEIV